jgi:proton-dependent oligopeptide transporter, POT family
MDSATLSKPQSTVPEFSQTLGHPQPLWMLFMAEFWERFAFYGIRWALVLYMVAQFHGGDSSGEAPANAIYGAYLALVYAAAIFGGFVADRLIGYQRSIIIGAVFMAVGLFIISLPHPELLRIGLATIIVGNGLFKPNISTMVGKIYAPDDQRRDFGFVIFYMGINIGAFLAPIFTDWLGRVVFGTPEAPQYKVVFIASSIGMVISLIWFHFGKAQLKSVGLPLDVAAANKWTPKVILAGLLGIGVFYMLLVANELVVLGLLVSIFIYLAFTMFRSGASHGKVASERIRAMFIIFVFNAVFWMFFEQAGSSFNFLAEKIVNRDLNGFIFPTAWFQSVNSIAIIILAPLIGSLWLFMGKWNPSIPRKFALGLIFNGLAFLLLIYALSHLVGPTNLIPFWTLFMVYVIQSAGEQCLSPVGLSMVTKLAPSTLSGLAMGGWFLSIGIGNSMSGIFAALVSGTEGISVASALSGYTMGFWALSICGVLLFLIAPIVNRWMNGVK